MDHCEAQEIQNKLLFLLVANRIKPAAIISLSPHSAQFSDGKIKYSGMWCEHGTAEEFISHLDRLLYTCIKHQAVYATRSSDDVECGDVELLKKKLGDYSGLFENFAEKHPEVNEFIYVDSFEFMLGYGNKFKILIDAKDEVQTGLALGYPEDAVLEFARQGMNAKRNYDAKLNQIKSSGIQLPSWMAYLDHIPVIEFSGSEVRSSSKQLAKRYQDFIREKNPSLAERVEALFLQLTNHQINSKSKFLQAPIYILNSVSEAYGVRKP